LKGVGTGAEAGAVVPVGPGVGHAVAPVDCGREVGAAVEVPGVPVEDIVVTGESCRQKKDEIEGQGR
jgi:hypothetical protein